MAETVVAEEQSHDLGTGTALATLTFAPPKGQPTVARVLAIHGWLDNALTWHGIAPALAQAGVHLVCVDLVGHGLSSGTAQEDGTVREGGRRDAGLGLPDMVEDMVALLSVLGWVPLDDDSGRGGDPAGDGVPVCLLGHSLGGCIATALAAVLGSRVARLCILESLVVTRPADHVATLGERIMHNVRLSVKLHDDSRPVPTYGSLDECIDRRLNGSRAMGWSMTRDSVRTLCQRGCVQRTVDGRWQFAHNSAHKRRTVVSLVDEQAAALVSAIECPVRAVFFRESRISTPVELRTRLGALCRGGYAEFVCSGDHHAHLDDPAETLPLVRDFLTGARE